MSTRAASAATALRAKQELIRLLSHKQSPANASVLAAATSLVNFHGSDKTDHGKRNAANGGIHQDHHSVYSYNDLRSAYLERIHVLHPDKTKYQTLLDKDEEQPPVDSGNTNLREGDVARKSKRNHHDEFVALQEAWKRYEGLVKKSLLDSTKGQDINEGSFTMFGVGCSFSDNEAERALREEITNQACRGWFADGQLEASSLKANQDNKRATTTKMTTVDASTELSDDDMFAEESSQNESEIQSYKTKGPIVYNNAGRSSSIGPRKSLVDHMIPRKYGK